MGVTGLGLPVVGCTLAQQLVQLVSLVLQSRWTVVAVSTISTSPTAMSLAAMPCLPTRGLKAISTESAN